MSAAAAGLGLLGAGLGLGLVLLAAGWRGTTPALPHLVAGLVGRGRRLLGPGRAAAGSIAGSVAGIAAAGLGVAVVTGWVAGGVLAALAAGLLPRLLGPDRDATRRAARIEAVASWTEMLRDTLAAAAGLEQTILATAHTAPEPLRHEIAELAARLRHGERLPAALRGFAEQVADPTADLVVAALVLAAEHQARQLADLLGELAGEAREQVAMRLRVAAGRARTRTSVRVIVSTTLAFAAGLVVLDRPYLRPYDSPVGQLVLLLVGGLFAVAIWWLTRIARIAEPDRLLTNPTTSTAGSGRDAAGAGVGQQAWTEAGA
jgi:tight adherence protein B